MSVFVEYLLCYMVKKKKDIRYRWAESVATTSIERHRASSMLTFAILLYVNVRLRCIHKLGKLNILSTDRYVCH